MGGLLIIITNASAGTQRVVSRVSESLNHRKFPYVLLGSRAFTAPYAELASQGTGEVVVPELSSFAYRLWAKLVKTIKPSMYYPLLLQLRAQELIHRYNITAAFIPWMLEPAFRKLPIKTGAMMMDIAWHVHPELFKPAAELESTLLHNISIVDAVFPISTFSENQLLDVFPEAKNKVYTIPHGADQVSASIHRTNPNQELNFLYPAALRPNKDHALLLQAMANLLAQGHRFRLTLTGPETDKLFHAEPNKDDSYQHSLWEILHNHPHLKEQITACGNLSEEEVENAYANCDAVILPTYYEGFGLPLVEALSRGLPVICTDIEPFQEQIERYQAKSRALVFTAQDLSSLEKQWLHFIEAPLPPLDQDQIEAQIKAWTWDDAVDAYLQRLGIKGTVE